MSRVRTTVSERVIQKVADATNSDPLELPPLYGPIDPDALDALIEQMSDGTVSFTYVGQEVTVNSDGTIRLNNSPAARATPKLSVGND